MDKFRALHDAISETGLPTIVRQSSDNESILITQGREDFCGLELQFRFLNDAMLVVRCSATCRIPEGARSEADKLVGMVNSRLAVGNVFIDEYGDVGFHAATFADDDTVSRIAQYLLCVATLVMQKFIPAFLSIVFANESSEAAFLVA